MKKLTNKRLLLISFVLLPINLALSFILFTLDNSTIEHLDGTEIQAHTSELLWTLIRGQIISMPIFSLLIGLIVAIFIDRNLPYSQRIVRSFLITLVAVYGLLICMALKRGTVGSSL